MKKKIKRIRKIKFGLRFKFTAIIIAAIAFSSFLISFAVYNQNEQRINEDMLKLGSTILNGASSYGSTYLNSTREINHLQGIKKPTLAQKKKLTRLKENQEESFKKLLNYFPHMVKREKLLDISFLIKFKKNSRKKNRAEFIYFDREKPRVKYRTSADPQLKPSIYRHYTSKIVTDSYLTFTKGRKKDEESFIIVGIPIFNKASDMKHYKNYLNLKKRRLKNRKDVLRQQKSYRYYRNDFIKRIISANGELNYMVKVNGKKSRRRLLYNIFRNYIIEENRKEIYESFEKLISPRNESREVALSEIKSITAKVVKQNGLKLKEGVLTKDIWRKFYFFLKRNKYRINVEESTHRLAFLAYRCNLNGVLGLFIYRHAYHTQKEAYTREIVNLVVSIFIRCIFIAFFFPTFIIRTVSRLAAGAKNIGRGKFDQKIVIGGRDELGQLADIFNEMANDLNSAKAVMLEKQRMESELITAQQIQNTLLPKEFPEFGKIQFGAYYSSASESGGDYYDLIKLSEDQVGIAVADVSGHGVGSGLVMAITRTLLHIYCNKTKSPKAILEKINQYLYENTAANYFVSMFYGIYDKKEKKLSYCSAGHNQSILLRDGNLKLLPAEGIALGAVSNNTFSPMASVRTVVLDKNDIFIQYTDGIVEAMDKDNNEYGEERFYGALKDNIGKSPQELTDSIIESVNRFTGKIPQHDDITMVTLKII